MELLLREQVVRPYARCKTYSMMQHRYRWCLLCSSFNGTARAILDRVKTTFATLLHNLPSREEVFLVSVE